VLHFIEHYFGPIWRFEASLGETIFHVEHEGQIAGFSTHDANNRGLGFFGPTGVAPEWRGRGFGRQLLLASLADLARRGYARAVIPWTEAIDFYRKACGPSSRITSRSCVESPVKKSARPRMKSKRRQRFLPQAIGMTGGVALAAVAFWFFKKQAEHVVEGRADRYDMMVFDVVHKIDNPPMHHFMEAVTQLGSHAAIGTAAGVTALAMLRNGRRSDAWTVVVSTGGAMVINTLLKNLFQRQRPQELARRIALPSPTAFPAATRCSPLRPIPSWLITSYRGSRWGCRPWSIPWPA